MVFVCRYRRSGKYHDKSVNALHVSDNGYIITASLGSKYDDDDDVYNEKPSPGLLKSGR